MWIEHPKMERKILPSLTQEQVKLIMEQAESIRDKSIVSLFADSGLRLAELSSINIGDIDWEARIVKVKVKGNKEGLALFGEHTEKLLKAWLAEYSANSCIWDITFDGISDMLERLSAKTGIYFTAHCFRRGFATTLAKKGVNELSIMRLGRWSSLSMVQHYTESLKFKDAMQFYTAIVN